MAHFFRRLPSVSATTAAATAVAAASLVGLRARNSSANRQLEALPESRPAAAAALKLRQLSAALASSGAVAVKPEQPADDQTKPSGTSNYRERRFMDFASVEFDGVAYMTPQDFLESVTQDRPRYRKRRLVLSQPELAGALYKTPSRWWASSKLFRSMGSDGIISYAEYLFLLCILAKPNAGFEIAFKMLDLARNQRVDKREFTVLNKMMSRQPGDQAPIDIDDMTAVQDTTLMLHFFGRSGKDKLDFKEFSKFMTNLQTEVLEIEFAEFSRGLQTISESEFAQVLLRYTHLSDEAQQAYLQRVKEKLVREEGIKFEDFRLFFQFLNHLEDFTMAMKMYSLAGHSISQEEFQRAVKACVGYTLAPHLVATVFLLFDKDDDGHLSYQEFLSILKDRLRGLSSRPASADTAAEKFKRCVGQQMREES